MQEFPVTAWLHELFLFPADFSRRLRARRNHGPGPTKKNAARLIHPAIIKSKEIKRL
jgi:hypothetical protein